MPYHQVATDTTLFTGAAGLVRAAYLSTGNARR
jgi:hypothetical protein